MMMKLHGDGSRPAADGLRPAANEIWIAEGQ
jgi:hypothetical protein